jgi:hypothetical protein
MIKVHKIIKKEGFFFIEFELVSVAYTWTPRSFWVYKHFNPKEYNCTQHLTGVKFCSYPAVLCIVSGLTASPNLMFVGCIQSSN